MYIIPGLYGTFSIAEKLEDVPLDRRADAIYIEVMPIDIPEAGLVSVPSFDTYTKTIAYKHLAPDIGITEGGGLFGQIEG